MLHSEILLDNHNYIQGQQNSFLSCFKQDIQISINPTSKFKWLVNFCMKILALTSIYNKNTPIWKRCGVV